MIVTRAPLRVSFLGGGSDYPQYINNHRGAVLGCAINLYVYTNALALPPFAAEKIRFTYRKTESVNSAAELEHPVVRAAFIKYGFNMPINLATMADVAGNSGLGSSSAFTVSIVKIVNEVMNLDMNRMQIAMEAIDIERNILNEGGGYQDQLFSTFGGMRKFEFQKGKLPAEDEVTDLNFISRIEDLMILLPFGEARKSKIFAQKHIQLLHENQINHQVEKSVDLALQVFRTIKENPTSSETVKIFLDAINVNWSIKLQMSNDSDLHLAASFIELAIRRGAYAGKLCGAGSTGFILLFCEKEMQEKVLKELNVKYYIRPKVDYQGAMLHHFESNTNSKILNT
jgi:D-glycero-alpha-D-manno-heptose-7-phosphate kinase